MSIFTFKQFQVYHHESSMKVGSDAILLGALLEAEAHSKILDVGTGCGVIALMLAQRFLGQITAIDIHPSSVLEASTNFKNGPWSERMTAQNCSFQQYSIENPSAIDVVVCNPPFFVNALKSPDKVRAAARHTDSLPFSDLSASVSRVLTEYGCFWVILPTDGSRLLEKEMNAQGFSCVKEWLIAPMYERKPNRIVSMYRRGSILSHEVQSESIALRNSDYSYTQEYKRITKDYYTGKAFR